MRTIYFVLLLLAYSPVSNSQQMYFPLSKGNTWSYRGYGPWGVVEVKNDTVMPNSKKYSIINSYFNSVTLFRQEGNKVFQYSNNGDVLFFNFDAAPGDTITSIPGAYDTTDIIMRTSDKITIFGRQLRHWIISIDWFRKRIDDEQWIDIVDSIGISGLTTSNASQHLSSATIDNRTYIATSTNESVNLISGFFLSQNYPNPFNPSTRITFSLPTRSYVSLKIFNVIGTEVATIIASDLPPGYHDAQWNAAGLPSGIYFYRLQAGSFTETKKLMVLK